VNYPFKTIFVKQNCDITVVLQHLVQETEHFREAVLRGRMKFT